MVKAFVVLHGARGRKDGFDSWPLCSGHGTI